jgi:hypothetical protein
MPDTRRVRERVSRALAVAAIVASVLLGACSPLPNPNPSSPANQLPGVGSPNQLNGGGSPAP